MRHLRILAALITVFIFIAYATDLIPDASSRLPAAGDGISHPIR